MNPSTNPEFRSAIGRGSPSRASLIACLLVCAGLVVWAPARGDATTAPGAESAWGIDGWNLQTSLYTFHFHPDPDHVNHQHMIDLELRFNNDWLAGFSYFDNSFGQPSELLYAGKTWPLFQSPHWYVKVIGGLLYGYKEPYEDKIPLNQLGIAPAIVPSLGFKYRHLVVEAHLGGLAVMTFTAGIRF